MYVSVPLLLLILSATLTTGRLVLVFVVSLVVSETDYRIRLGYDSFDGFFEVIV